MKVFPSTAIVLLLLIQSGCSEPDEREFFNPRKLMPAIKAITDARISKPSAATNKVGESDLVIGLAVGGSARAYPINPLTGPQREIINDELGGRKIAATW